MQCNRAKAYLGALGMSLIFSIGAAYAGEKTLEFELVTKYLEPRTLDAFNIENQSIMQAKAFGVAIFKDGRFGTKDYIVVIDGRKDTGTVFGYSTYNFQEGTITARFTGAFDAQGSRGDYKILSGTGAYAGATGSGTWEGIPNPFKGSGLFKIKLQVITP